MSHTSSSSLAAEHSPDVDVFVTPFTERPTPFPLDEPSTSLTSEANFDGDVSEIDYCVEIGAGQRQQEVARGFMHRSEVKDAMDNGKQLSRSNSAPINPCGTSHPTKHSEQHISTSLNSKLLVALRSTSNSKVVVQSQSSHHAKFSAGNNTQIQETTETASSTSLKTRRAQRPSASTAPYSVPSQRVGNMGRPSNARATSNPETRRALSGRKKINVALVDNAQMSSFSLTPLLPQQIMSIENDICQRRAVSICPSMTLIPESTTASPASTHTNVHVITLAPLTTDEIHNSQILDNPPTPTMQIMASEDGQFEVIWNKVPNDNQDMRQRRSSSASVALAGIESRVARGGEATTNKFSKTCEATHWSSSQFTPKLVVFPDDEWSRKNTPLTSDEKTVKAPTLNFGQPSTIHGQLPFRPASKPTVQSTNPHPDIDEEHQQSSDWTSPAVQALGISFRETNFSPKPRSSNTTSESVASHKVSTALTSDAETSYQQDSINPHHFHSPPHFGIPPTLLAKRDSVAIAKKRMHRRNRETDLSARRRKSSAVAFGGFDAFEDDSGDEDRHQAERANIKKNAAQALKGGAVQGILCKSSMSEGRHIKIAD